MHRTVEGQNMTAAGVQLPLCKDARAGTDIPSGTDGAKKVGAKNGRG